jgi:hypothetical protein
MYKDDMNIEVQRLKNSHFTLTHTDVLIFTVFLSKTRTTFLTEGKQRPRLQVPVHDVHGVNLKWQCGTVQCCA